MKKFFVVVFPFLLLVSAQSATPTPSVVAVVNGEEITRDQLDRFTDLSRIVLTIYQQFPRFAQVLVSTEEGKAFLKAYERDVLESIITWKLLVQEARRRGVAVPEDKLQAEVDRVLKSIMQRNSLATEEELAEAVVTQLGQTLEEFKSMLRAEAEERFLVDLLKDEVTGGVSVSPEEVAAYYEENKDAFTDEAGGVKSLEEVSGKIEEELLQEKRDRVWSEFLKELRESAEVEIYL